MPDSFKFHWRSSKIQFRVKLNFRTFGPKIGFKADGPEPTPIFADIPAGSEVRDVGSFHTGCIILWHISDMQSLVYFALLLSISPFVTAQPFHADLRKRKMSAGPIIFKPTQIQPHD
jgi:hypothetical protein